jgi:AcrR family transcriptional regulator
METMTRWKPDAPGRLMLAALELFEERGFEATTVAEIAARAGLTERTFFRHFADKREVLFRGGDRLTEAVLARLGTVEPGAGPLAAVATALEGADGLFERSFARRRHPVIAANPELEERELVKLARLGESLARALRDRGTDPRTAELAAQTGMAAFHVAFARWIEDPADGDWVGHLRAALAELRELAVA